MIIAIRIEQYILASQIIMGILFAVLAFFICYYAFKLMEMGYVLKHKKPLYNHFYWRLKELKKNQKAVLYKDFSFFKKLNAKQKTYFEHRVALFIIDKDFIGRDQLIITDEMKVLISASAVMLTFGFRDYYIPLISKIVIYPTQFYSNTNNTYHKGEFNPRLKSLVLSWEAFKEGYDNETDNLNLGIHELTHAIHLNSLKQRDVSATIFSDSFKELSQLLSSKENLREELMASEYFRRYAYTNQFEFLAVAIENFIETPKDFRLQFPEVYAKVKQMLNFNVAGY
ncbi:MAG: zinc-dependent peptidase [Flavobacteriaceae bacterium]